MSNCTLTGREVKIAPCSETKVFFTIKAVLMLLIFTLFIGDIAQGQTCTTTTCPNYPRAARTTGSATYGADLFISPLNSNPRTSVVFNEAVCLPAAAVSNTVACSLGGSNCNCTLLGSHFKVRAWYIDEHALTLGVNTVIITGGSNPGTYFSTVDTNTNGNTTPMQLGFTDATGDFSGNDNALTDAKGGGRPLHPTLFVTDITTDNKEPYAGDWQQGGPGFNPSNIYGTFKPTTKKINKTTNPFTISFTPPADPAQNAVTTLPVQPPAGTARDKYNTLVEWDIDAINAQVPGRFEAGHTYRLQFMVHDGDQNKSGGDVGQRCATVHINNPPKPPHCFFISACAGSTVKLFDADEPNDPTTTYSWVITAGDPGTIVGPSNQDTISVLLGSSGTVRATLTKTRDGVSESCTSQVTIVPNPSGTVTGPGPAVCGNSTGNVYQANLDAIPAGLVVVVEHSWSVSGNASIPGATNGSSVSVDAGASGSYTVTDLVTYTEADPVNAFGHAVCINSISKNVTINPIPTCNITGPDPVCGNTTNTYSSTVSPGGGTVTHSWTITGDGHINGATDGATVSVTADNLDGTYTLRDQVTRNGCPSDAPCAKAVIVNKIPTCSISGPADVCAGSTNTYTSTVSPPGGTVTHQWFLSGSGTINGATDGPTLSVTAGPAGTSYSVFDLVSRNGCFSIAPCSENVNNRLCDIDLFKSVNKSEIASGTTTTVIYSYHACNIGFFPITNAILVDDNGTPGNTADDQTVATNQSFGVGQCKDYTLSRNLTGTTTNIACIDGTSGGVPVNACDDTTVLEFPVSISLVKTANPTDIALGTSTPVTYTYVGCNTGAKFSFTGNLVDDNGTPGNTGDDFTVATNITLAPGACQTFTAVRNLTSGRTNIANLCGTSGGKPLCAPDDATVVDHPVSIGLTKTPNVCEIVTGTPTAVTYTYVVTNTGPFFSASGTLKDDNGTPGSTGDDFTVGTWGPLAPGASQTLTATRTLTTGRTNIATASGTSGGAAVSATASATVATITCLCDIEHEYPASFNAANPRTSVAFNENGCAAASSPSRTSCATSGGLIRLWYIDEHAMSMGVSQISVKTSGGTSVSCSGTVCPNGSYNSSQLGCTGSGVEQSGDDGALDGQGHVLANNEGRPIRPSLFITDVTFNVNNRDGDWQYGGQSYNPTAVEGTWKNTLKLVDKTVTPWKVTFTPGVDPATNAVSTLSVQPPAGTATDKYNTLITWDPSQIGYTFKQGHTYRLQFMVHDGDQNKAGGDVGEKCATYFQPSTFPCTPPTPKMDDEAGLPSANALGTEADQTSDARFSVYPNPASEKLNLTFVTPMGGDARISMTDVNGKLLSDLYKGTVESGQVNNTTVDMNNFADGVYIIQFKCHDSIITKKLILQK